MRKWLSSLLLGPVAVMVTAIFAPQVLAFPHRYDIAGDTVWTEQAASEADLRRVIERSQALVAASPIAEGNEHRRIFLTDGGWRWAVLSLSSRGGFALTRPLTDPVIVVNRSDARLDRVWNGAEIGGERSLSGTIAHETTHGVLRGHFGLVDMVLAPRWLVEGYCDFVAQESSLSSEDVAALEAEGRLHPAIPYYEGRRRVADILAGNGGSVDALFDHAD